MRLLIAKILANKHTSGASVVCVGTIVLSKIGAIWFPAHAEQFRQTAEIIKDAAFTYGLLMAGDAKPNQ